jgi:hypothetical protein
MNIDRLQDNLRKHLLKNSALQKSEKIEIYGVSLSSYPRGFSFSLILKDFERS